MSKRKQNQESRPGVGYVINQAWQKEDILYDWVEEGGTEGWLNDPELSQELIGKKSRGRLEYKVDPRDKTNLFVRPVALSGLVSEEEYIRKMENQVDVKTFTLIKLGISKHRRVWVDGEGYRYENKELEYLNPLTWILLLAVAVVYFAYSIWFAIKRAYKRAVEFVKELKEFYYETSTYQEDDYDES